MTVTLADVVAWARREVRRMIVAEVMIEVRIQQNKDFLTVVAALLRDVQEQELRYPPFPIKARWLQRAIVAELTRRQICQI
jgi:hypothetical protein